MMRKHQRKNPVCMMCRRIVATTMVSALLHGLAAPPPALAAGSAADEILEATGVQGGLVIHVGCGDGRLTAALGARDGYLVQGLDADAANVEKARAYLQSRGLYGKVSVDRLSGNRLPYIDNLVNLVVASGERQVPREVIVRVLCPGGAAVELDPETQSPKPDTVFHKPWPEEIDQWTHYLHDPTNNAVSQDKTIAPPHAMDRQSTLVAAPRPHRFPHRPLALRLNGGFDELPASTIVPCD